MATLNVSLQTIDLDVDNPRYEHQSSQFEALESIITQQGDKVLNLIKHIAEHGLNPTELMAVVPSGEGRYTVVEGNRRLTALRLLHRPSLISGLNIKDAQKRALHKAAERPKVPVPDQIACAIFQDKDVARVWIELKHTGQNSGAGVVPWDGVQTARFRQDTAPLAVLAFAQKHNLLSASAVSQFPISTLDRLIADPYVRDALGMTLTAGRLESAIDAVEVRKGVGRIVKDLASGDITVTDLKRKADRKAYVDGWSAKDRPKLSKVVAKWSLADEGPQSKTAVAKSTAKAAATNRSNSRKYLVPGDFRASIPDPRLQSILRELQRKLKMADTPNAVVVMLRVFVELSTDSYLERNKLPLVDKSGRLLELSAKVTAAADHLVQTGKARKSALLMVRRATSVNSSSTSITTFHAFVHNRRASPVPSEIPEFWNNFEPYISALYAP